MGPSVKTLVEFHTMIFNFQDTCNSNYCEGLCSKDWEYERCHEWGKQHLRDAILLRSFY